MNRRRVLGVVSAVIVLLASIPTSLSATPSRLQKTMTSMHEVAGLDVGGFRLGMSAEAALKIIADQYGDPVRVDRIEVRGRDRDNLDPLACLFSVAYPMSDGRFAGASAAFSLRFAKPDGKTSVNLSFYNDFREPKTTCRISRIEYSQNVDVIKSGNAKLFLSYLDQKYGIPTLRKPQIPGFEDSLDVYWCSHLVVSWGERECSGSYLRAYSNSRNFDQDGSGHEIWSLDLSDPDVEGQLRKAWMFHNQVDTPKPQF